MLGCDGESRSRVRYKLTIVTGLLECLCFAGVVFGWASLVFVLKTDGYFSDLCVNVTTANGTTDNDCSAQDERLSVIFTVASFMNNFLTFPNGFLFDLYGTMATRLLAILLYTTGTLLVAFSSKALSLILFPALSFIAVGGILLLLTNMQVGNLCGTHRSTIITLYNGAFDSSSAIFLIIKVLYEKGISLQTSFLFLSACGIIHLLRTLFLLPKSHIPYSIPESYTYGVSCRKSKSYNVEQNELKQESTPDSERQGMSRDCEPIRTEVSPQMEDVLNRDSSFKNCVLSWIFVWHLIWLSVMQLRNYLFIGTLNPMLNRLANQDPATARSPHTSRVGGSIPASALCVWSLHVLPLPSGVSSGYSGFLPRSKDMHVSHYTNAFAFTQLTGFLCAPWNGFLMDRHKGKALKPGETEKEADLRSSILSLFFTSLQCLLFSVCTTIPVLPLQYATFVLQVLNRSFLFGGNAAFISIAFPAKHFGKLFGLVMSLSAVVLLLQYPCLALVKSFGGDPFYVNLILTILILLAFVHPLNVFFHCRNLAAQRGNTQSMLHADSSRRESTL